MRRDGGGAASRFGLTSRDDRERRCCGRLQRSAPPVEPALRSVHYWFYDRVSARPAAAVARLFEEYRRPELRRVQTGRSGWRCGPDTEQAAPRTPAARRAARLACARNWAPKDPARKSRPAEAGYIWRIPTRWIRSCRGGRRSQAPPPG